MNVIVFFSQTNKLIEYVSLAAPYNGSPVNYHFISTTLLSAADQEMLINNKINFIETENINYAFDQASEQINKEECVITVVDVMPKDNWFETIHKEKELLKDMGSAIGRWYKTVKPGRENLKLNKIGVKYIDQTPELICNYIVDHSPSLVTHAKKISRFPVFFNWFSADMSGTVANCLKVSSSFSEFAHFLGDEMNRPESKESIYYINSLEIIDLKLLS